MAWTRWYTPQTVEYIDNDSGEIGYTDGDGVLDRSYNLITLEPVYGVGTSANSGAVNTYGARSLLLRQFDISGPGSVSGIELRTDILRLNRVRDHRIQLWLGNAQGENRASDSYEALQTYGGAGDTWGIVGPFDYTDSNFGVVIDLAPHDRFPSSTRPIIRKVEIRLNLV